MSKGPRNVVVVQGMLGASEGVREDVGVRDSLVSLKKINEYFNYNETNKRKAYCSTG